MRLCECGAHLCQRLDRPNTACRPARCSSSANPSALSVFCFPTPPSLLFEIIGQGEQRSEGLE